MANILTLAAYEQAQRALRGDSDVHSATQSEARTYHTAIKRTGNH